MRLIDADDFIKWVQQCGERCPTVSVEKLFNKLKDTQTIDSVKHGKWIFHRWEDEYVCSVCGHPAEIIEVDGHLVGCDDPSGETGGHFEVDTDVFLAPYCPYCGAQMENPAENIVDEDE